MNEQKNIFRFIFLTGIITEIFYLIFLNYNHAEGDIPLYMFTYFESFLIMLTCYYFIKKIKIDEPSEIIKIETAEGKSRILKFLAKILSIKEKDTYKLKIPLVIIIFGILFRLTLFSAVETTSPDVNRYVWEGKVIYNGYNPYILSPNNPQLDKFHDRVYEKVTYKNMTAIYPPLSQLMFVTAYFISGDDLSGLKLIYMIFDLMIIFFLLKLLYLKGIDLKNIILYSWMPLFIMEYYVNTHLDIIGIFFMLLFIYQMELNEYISASVSLAFAFISKMYPIILFPLIIKRVGIKKTFYFILIFITFVAIFYLPFIYKDISIFSSLITYLKSWQFNASLFYLLNHYLNNGEMARLLCTGGFILSIFLISIFYKDFTKASYAIFICLIIFGTTLYPWYLGWVATINPFYNFSSVVSLLFTINLSNFTALSTKWKEYFFVLLIEYIPFFSLLIFDITKIILKKRKAKALEE